MIVLCSAKRADNGKEQDTIAPDAGQLFCQRMQGGAGGGRGICSHAISWRFRLDYFSSPLMGED